MAGFTKRQVRRIGQLLQFVLRLVRGILAGAYYLVARSFFYLLTLCLAAYFFINSFYFTNLLNRALGSGAMPGSLYFGQITWGPLPWRAQVFKLVISDPRKTPIIKAEYVRCSVNLYRLLRSLTANMVWGDNLLDLTITDVEVYNSRTFLEFDKTMVFMFTDAFSRRNAPPSKGEGLQVRLTMPDITLFGGTVHLRFPFANIDTRLNKLTAQVFLENDRVRVYGPRIDIRSGEMQFKAVGELPAGEKPLRFEWNHLLVRNFFTNGDVVRIPDGEGEFPLSPIRFGGEIWTRDPGKFDLRTSLNLKPGDPLVARFTNGLVNGPISGTFRMFGTMENVKANVDLRSPQLQVRGIPVTNLAVKGRFGKDFLANPKGEYQYDLQTLSASVFGGTLSIADARYRPLWTVRNRPAANKKRGKSRRKTGKPTSTQPIGPTVITHGLQLKAQLKQIDTAPLIAHLLAGTSKPAVAALKKRIGFLFGNLTGSIAISRDRDENQLAGNVDLKMTQHQRAGVLLNRKYSLVGGLDLRVVLAPGKPNQGLLERLSHVAIGARRLRLGSGRDYVLVSRGRLLPLTQQLENVVFRLESRRVKELLTRLTGFRDLDGNLSITDGKVFGEFNRPTIRVSALLDKASLLGVELGHVSATATLRPSGVIQVAQLRVKSNWASRLEARGTLRLHHGGWDKLSRTFPLQIPKHGLRVEGVSLTKLRQHAPGLKATLAKLPARGTISLTDGSLSAWLSDFSRRLSLSGKLKLREIDFHGEHLEQGSASIALSPTQIALADVTLKLRGLAQPIAGRLTYQPKSQRIDGTARIARLNLRRFSTPTMALKGSTSLAVKVAGTVKAPRLSGRVTFSKLRYNAFTLGNATLRLSEKSAGRAVITSTAFFHGLQLLPNAELRWSGTNFLGFRLSMKALPTAPLHVDRLYSEIKSYLSQSRLVGKIDLSLDLSKRVPFSAVVTVPRSGLQLKVDESTIVTNENVNPARIGFENGALTIKGLALRSYPADTDPQRISQMPTLTIDGRMSADTSLDVSLKGELNLSVLRAFDVISAIEGKARINLAIRGNILRPQVTGRLSFGETSLVPAGFGREILISKAAFVIGPIPGRPGWQSLRLEEKDAIHGSIDGGKFEISGALELEQWRPKNVLIKLSAAEFEYKSPGDYELTLQTIDRHLTFTGTNILERRKRSMKLEGSVRLISGQYFKRFDSLTRGFSQFLGGRQVQRYSKPIDEIFPWIRRVKLELAITGSRDFFVRTRFQFGRTDLELQTDVKVAGTYAKPSVTGQIKILEGTINYNLASGRRFEIDESKLNGITFSGDVTRPYVDVTAHTTVIYEVDRISRRRFALDDDLLDGDEREEKVYIQIYGELDKLKYKLYAEAGRYDQQSLLHLIAFGRPIDSQNTSATFGFAMSSELFSALPKLLLGALVDEVSLGIGPQLGVFVQVFKRVGNWLKLRARITQGGDQSKVQAGFKFRLTDRLSLEGQFKVNRKENTQQYDGKLKYTIPLN